MLPIISNSTSSASLASSSNRRIQNQFNRERIEKKFKKLNTCLLNNFFKIEQKLLNKLINNLQNFLKIKINKKDFNYNSDLNNSNKIKINTVMNKIANSRVQNVESFVNETDANSSIDPDPDDITIINQDELNALIRGILVARARDGATIQEVKMDYYNLIGENFPIYDNITDYLLSIPNVTCSVNENGCRIFNVSTSEKSQHLIEMIKKQKPSRQLNFNKQELVQQPQDEKLNTDMTSKNPILYSANPMTSQYNNNLNYYHQNFVSQKEKKYLHPNDLLYNKNNINNKNYQIRNQQNENFYDDNLCLRKLPLNNKHHNNFFHQLNQQQNQFYSTNNRQRIPRRSTPMNEQYDYDMEINEINDYITRNNNDNDNLCFFEDNYKYLYNKIAGSTETLSGKPISSNCTSFNSRQESEIMKNFNNPFHNKYNVYENNKEYYLEKQNIENFAHINDYVLLGDDFFLSLARAEIGCKLKKGNLRHQSGLCVSGQTIREAAFRILNEEYLHKKIIVNIGSVDFLQDHHLIDIQQDFLQLLEAFEKRNIVPILTTLAPLANLGHKQEIKKNLQCFNDFIRRSGLPFIDIWTKMASVNGNTQYNCYQSGAKYVSGSIYPHVLWNTVGRQRVLNKIKSELASTERILSRFF